jgi:signal transduction histidine kinase
MEKFHFERCVLAIASILLLLLGTDLRSQTADPRQVLILNTYDGTAAPFGFPKDVFRAELQRQFVEPIAFNEMNLDARTDEFNESDGLLAELLRNRYADAPPDIVFAVGPPGIRFWLDHRDSIAGQAPLIALTRDGLFSPQDLRPGDIGRFTRFSFTDAMDDILQIRPGTSHVVMVFGSSPYERAIAAQAKRELGASSERLRFEYTTDMTLHEMQVRLRELSEESAVWSGVLNIDAAGVILPQDSGLAVVRSASPVPVFGGLEDQVGQGIVGGRLVRLQEIGLDAAASGAAIIRGEPVRDAWKVFELSTPVYDWRELDRWGIDIDLLPAGSEIRHRQPTLWDQYAAWIVLVAAVITLQSLLITSLMTQRRRRHSAELAQEKLSGQLINAYEDERRAIARELHDDLSQRLARLAIDAGLIGQDSISDAADDEFKELREELARVSEDVHDMSYRLHPSLVEDLGISTALRTECQRVRRYCDVQIKEHIDEIRERIPNPAALCAYRVIQEALNNAVRHAKADSIEITLEKDGQTLKLEVSDDGIGFDKARAKSSEHIGLSSMRERVRLLDGKLRIRSEPGAGSTVSAVVPLNGVNP